MKKAHSPSGAENLVPKSNGHQILNHFLAQVVIDSVNLKYFQCKGNDGLV